jgi:hypothetical protein
MKTITLAIGLMVLIALSPYVLAEGPGEPDTMIVINPDNLSVEFLKFDPGVTFTITFDRVPGADKVLEGTINETVGWAYHVGIDCSSIEDGECVQLPPGDYEVSAEATNLGIDYSVNGTITVPNK